MLSRIPLRIAIPRVPQPRTVKIIEFSGLVLTPLGTLRAAIADEV